MKNAEWQSERVSSFGLLPSAFVPAGGRPFHVVAACDEAREQVFIITAYEPSLEIFEADYRTKRKP
jgi:hypothetical protein